MYIGTQTILLIFLGSSLLIHSAPSLCFAFSPHSDFQKGSTSAIGGDSLSSILFLPLVYSLFILGFPFSYLLIY